MLLRTNRFVCADGFRVDYRQERRGVSGRKDRRKREGLDLSVCITLVVRFSQHKGKL
jgi:hypothetical protein